MVVLNRGTGSNDAAPNYPRSFIMLWFILCLIAFPVSFWGGIVIGAATGMSVALWVVLIFIAFIFAIASVS